MNQASTIGLSIALLTLLFVFLQSEPAEQTIDLGSSNSEKQLFSSDYGTPLINGIGDDAVWEAAEWLPLDQLWLGEMPEAADFTGRYKIAWDENNLYVLAEIVDDTLMDMHPDGLQQYWDDDCLEIFIDEDASGGEHQYSYNAFAYHIALDNKVVDIRPDRSPAYFNNHCTTRRVTNGNISTWEVAVTVYDGNKYDAGGENIPKMLSKGKKMGFALAYCDNDHSAERETFIGSVRVEGNDKNRGWLDAGVFGLLTLE